MQHAVRQDTTLVQEVLAGNQASFQLLVERYEARLFALARRYTRSTVEVEDLVQDTFLKAFSRLESFQHQSSFYTWIYRIATNTILDSLKRRGRSPIQAVDDLEAAFDGPQASIARPDGGMEREEISQVTYAVLDSLPEIFRTVLIMREFESMAYQDIADVLEISIGTVESRIFRARARFKQRLLQLYPDFAQP